jgi:Na+/phosphate symporter
MEEKELTQRFHGLFEEVAPVLQNIKKGFLTQKGAVLRENQTKFREMIKSRVDFVQKLIEIKEKNEAEKKYLNLVLSFQIIASAIDNLTDKMAIKAESRVLFSEKAVKEIESLFKLMEDEVRDVRDLILTKNPHLKETIKTEKEKIVKMADEYSSVHEQRLITGVCMPKASYMYLDMADSIKRIGRGLNDFAEKV